MLKSRWCVQLKPGEEILSPRGINASRMAVNAKRIKDDVNIFDEMIECNRKNPDKVRECIRIGGELVTT